MSSHVITARTSPAAAALHIASGSVDGAAPCSVPGPALTEYWTADAENVPEGRQPALDVTRAFCQHLTGISRYY